MRTESWYYEEPFVRVSKGRNMAFVHGDDALVKTASLYFEHVIASRTSVSTDSREAIDALNRNGVRFVEVSEGKAVLQFVQGPNDWRNPDQLPDSEGTPGLSHSIYPSRYGRGPDLVPHPTMRTAWQGNEAHVVELFDANGEVSHCFMTPPMNHEFRDIAFVQRYLVSTSTVLDENADEVPGIALSNIDVLDLSSVDWHTIAELRKDETMIRGMQAIRLFVRETCEGRSLAYIEDKLGQLLMEQRDRAKAHGVSTRMGVLMDVLEAKDLQLAVGASVASLLFGSGPEQHLLQLASAGATVAIGGARVALATMKRRREARDDARGATYLIGLSDKLAAGSKGNGLVRPVVSPRLPGGSSE